MSSLLTPSAAPCDDASLRKAHPEIELKAWHGPKPTETGDTPTLNPKPQTQKPKALLAQEPAQPNALNPKSADTLNPKP